MRFREREIARNLVSQVVGLPIKLVVFYRGDSIPDYCYPMKIFPLPKVDVDVSSGIAKKIREAYSCNPAVHDGACMIEVLNRGGDNSRFIVRGWSYRLFPPVSNCVTEANRGSAYNSAIEYSRVCRVESVFLIGEQGFEGFQRGTLI